MSVRFGLLGAGRIGQVHARAITGDRDARLVAVTDVHAPSAELVAQTYGCAVRTLEDIETAEDIDAVVICTPTDTHSDLIERFSRVGKAIFCEKPIDLDVSRVKACLKTVADTGAVLMVGFNRRFDPSFIALREAVDEGAIGTIELAHITSRDPGPPPANYIKSSGGIFRDMTIHDFDMARFLLGEEISAVTATGSVFVDPEIGALGDFDTASVLLETPSGKQCTISNSRRATYGYDQRIELHGSAGMIAAENQRPVMLEIADAKGFHRPPLHDFFMTRYVDAYANEIAAFIAALRDGSVVTPTGEDGLKALMLAEAATLSAAEKRRVLVE